MPLLAGGRDDDRPSDQLLVTSALPLDWIDSAVPLLIVVMRHPIDRLIARFNAHRATIDFAPRNYSSALQLFRRASAAVLALTPPMTCVLAGMPPAACTREGVASNDGSNGSSNGGSIGGSNSSSDRERSSRSRSRSNSIGSSGGGSNGSSTSTSYTGSSGSITGTSYTSSGSSSSGGSSSSSSSGSSSSGSGSITGSHTGSSGSSSGGSSGGGGSTDGSTGQEIASSGDAQEMLRRARPRLRSSHVILLEEYEAGSAALCLRVLRALGRDVGGGGSGACAALPRQLPIVVGGEGIAVSGGSRDGVGPSAVNSSSSSSGSDGGGGHASGPFGNGHFLTREALQARHLPPSPLIPPDLPLPRPSLTFHLLTREALQADQPLLASLRRAEAADLALYAFARTLVRSRLGQSIPTGLANATAASDSRGSPASAAGLASVAGPAATAGRHAAARASAFALQRCASVDTLCPDPFDPLDDDLEDLESEIGAAGSEAADGALLGGDRAGSSAGLAQHRPGRRRRWADDFLPRVRRMRQDAPPSRRRAVLFTHIPKCAGSSFRNQLLLEFARVHRAPRDVACVLYRDVGFIEKLPSHSNLTRLGPACLSPEDGRFRPQLIVVTGHISFHPSLLGRFSTPFASVVFLREPLSRLVSLFNMYPDATFGAAPPNASDAAVRFESAYRRRLHSRNALTCFVGGASLCDSVGALGPDVVGRAALRRARFNLAHRYDVFGLTERADESMALVAWAFGWTDFYKARFHVADAAAAGAAAATAAAAASGGGSAARIIPGQEHRRLQLSELCRVPGLLEYMQAAERYDVLLHRFARVLYQQRLASLPPDALALLRAAARARGDSPPGQPGAARARGGAACAPTAALQRPSSEGGSVEDDVVHA